MTSLHTLIDIFDHEFENAGEKIQLKGIVIPIIQRDYAQGRKTPEVGRVRKRFLDAIYNAVTDTPITLDFVYGDIDENGIMTPLDGQQRLTTLFLLHWYIAKKEKVDKNKYDFLRRFSYETRYSARNFCEKLIDFEPSFEGNLSADIINQAWFPLDWEKDPTINAMLVMLDSIEERFADTSGIWDKLIAGSVSFYFLPIKDMGLTDELYIKMNSRGKPLTMFEHFKAELEHELSKTDKDKSKEIIRKIDIDWTDMLWVYRGDDNVIDDEFLRYFRFICDMICYRSGGTPQGKDYDEFDLLSVYFVNDKDHLKENIETLEKYFDCWCRLSREQAISDFFDSFIAVDEHEKGKVISDNGCTDYFEECLRLYGMVQSNGNRLFSLPQTTILYAFVMYLLNMDSITEDDFRRRLRIVRNMVDNSEYELSDSENRVGGNRMPAILKQVESIIVRGVIITDGEINFNAYQITEEVEKLSWTETNPDKAESLFEIEDHYLLYGQIGILGLEKPEYFSRFISLFENCDYDCIDCALLCMGEYLQRDRNGWRYQMGSAGNDEAWRNLFHRSASSRYEITKDCLKRLLSKAKEFSIELLTEIIDEYLKKCKEESAYDWRYYYMKYDVFRPGRYGRYWWNNYEDSPYCLVALWSKTQASTNAYQPFLKEVEENDNIDRDNLGQYLIYDDYYVACENSAYVFYEYDTDNEVYRLQIPQNDKGVDTVDRIKKYRAYIKRKGA